MKGTIVTVQRYFQDEQVLLEDWYNSFYSTELFPGEPVSIMPSPEKIREAFLKWVEDVKTQLYDLICIEWDYPKKRKDKRFDDEIALAAALAEFFIECTWKIPAPIASATLLVLMGLDKLCHIHLE